MLTLSTTTKTTTTNNNINSKNPEKLKLELFCNKPLHYTGKKLDTFYTVKHFKCLKRLSTCMCSEST